MTKRLDQLLNLLNENPKDDFITFAIAKEYEKNGELDKALQFYLELVTQNKNYVGTYYHLGKLYEELFKNDDALRAYEQGILIASDQNDLHAKSELQNAKMNLELEL